MMPITDLRRALNAEFSKLKHSPILVTVVVLPLLVITMIVFFMPLILPGAVPQYQQKDPWIAISTSMVETWASMLWFIVPLITAMLAAMEHNNNTWKHLFALPVSRHAILLAKMIVSIGLFGLSSLTVLVSLVVTGVAIGAIRPAIMQLGTPIPLLSITALVLLSYLASWLMIAIHTWVGMRWHGFSVPLSFGLVIFLLSVMITPNTKVYHVYPWVLSTNFINTSQTTPDWLYEHLAVTSVLLGVVGSIAIAAICAWDLSRRDIIER